MYGEACLFCFSWKMPPAEFDETRCVPISIHVSRSLLLPYAQENSLWLKFGPPSLPYDLSFWGLPLGGSGRRLLAPRRASGAQIAALRPKETSEIIRRVSARTVAATQRYDHFKGGQAQPPNERFSGFRPCVFGARRIQIPILQWSKPIRRGLRFAGSSYALGRFPKLLFRIRTWWLGVSVLNKMV